MTGIGRYKDRTGHGDAWRADAACRGTDPALFFTERDESQAAAKAVYAECPVRQECLAYALAAREDLGVWGGTSERERRRRRWRRPA